MPAYSRIPREKGAGVAIMGGRADEVEASGLIEFIHSEENIARMCWVFILGMGHNW